MPQATQRPLQSHPASSSQPPFPGGAPGRSVRGGRPPHTSPPSSVWSARQHSPWSRYGLSGPVTRPPPGSLAFSAAQASVGCRFPSRTRVELGLGEASPDWPLRRSLPRSPLSPRLPCGAAGRGTARCRAPIARPGSYLARVRVRAAGAGVPGSPPGAPPAGRSPRMLPAAVDVADCPSVSLSSATEDSMLAPSRRGPHPFTSHPPLPSWQGDGKRQLISSPHSACGRVLNSPRLITEHLISALPQRGVWGRLEVSVYSILRRGCVLITNRQGRSLALPPLPLPPLLTLPLSSPLLAFSPFPPFFPPPHATPSVCRI